MKKEMIQKIAVVIMSVCVVFGAGSISTSAASSQKHVSTVQKFKTKSANVTARKRIRKPKTIVRYRTMKKGKSDWIGLIQGGVWPETKNWKSSDPKVVAITKANWDSDHKIVAKKKGKATISCVVTNTNVVAGYWIKGDVHKWVITVQ